MAIYVAYSAEKRQYLSNMCASTVTQETTEGKTEVLSA